MSVDSMRPKYYLSTRDLVTVAVLASLGGALSTYIGYLGNLINRVMGVPFGAGQFMAGLHVLWIVLAIGITGKKGVGTLTGVIKGFIELFMGSTHGVVIVLVSAIQGLCADLVLLNDKVKLRRGIIAYSLAGGISSASNVFIFQAFYFSGVPIVLISVLAMLACSSGIIFGGWLPLQIIQSLELAGILHKRAEDRPEPRKHSDWHAVRSKPAFLAGIVVTIAFLAVFTVGAVYYFFAVYIPPGETGVEVTGNIEHAFVFDYDDFRDHEVTIRAELIGSVTHVPPQNYTGIPLQITLAKAAPRNGSKELTVIAKDGYQATFDLDKAMADEQLILVRENGSYRLIAANYDGAYWVRDVYKLEVK